MKHCRARRTDRTRRLTNFAKPSAQPVVVTAHGFRARAIIAIHKRYRIMDMPDTQSGSTLAAAFATLRTELASCIIGQTSLVDRLLIALLADGHLLVEGAPGLAKTTAIKELAARIEADFHRVQFTPDLLPADLTGTEIFRRSRRVSSSSAVRFSTISCLPTKSIARLPKSNRHCSKRWVSVRSRSVAPPIRCRHCSWSWRHKIQSSRKAPIHCRKRNWIDF